MKNKFEGKVFFDPLVPDNLGNKGHFSFKPDGDDYVRIWASGTVGGVLWTEKEIDNLIERDVWIMTKNSVLESFRKKL